MGKYGPIDEFIPQGPAPDTNERSCPSVLRSPPLQASALSNRFRIRHLLEALLDRLQVASHGGSRPLAITSLHGI
jgi:hypothetical protein